MGLSVEVTVLCKEAKASSLHLGCCACHLGQAHSHCFGAIGRGEKGGKAGGEEMMLEMEGDKQVHFIRKPSILGEHISALLASWSYPLIF